jgi:hypothetical protein
MDSRLFFARIGGVFFFGRRTMGVMGKVFIQVE